MERVLVEITDVVVLNPNPRFEHRKVALEAGAQDDRVEVLHLAVLEVDSIALDARDSRVADSNPPADDVRNERDVLAEDDLPGPIATLVVRLAIPRVHRIDVGLSPLGAQIDLGWVLGLTHVVDAT